MGISAARGVPRLWASVHDSGVVLERGDDLLLRLDLEGRWATLREKGILYRRLVDAGVVTFAAGARVPAEIPDPGSVHERARMSIRRVAREIRGGEVEVRMSRGSRDQLLTLMDAAVGWTPERFRELRRSFAAAYREPPLILPPDRYLDLIVQPAFGCPNRGCSFCAFYLDRPFRLATDAELARHLEALEGLFGRALAARRGVFLGSANALAMPQRRLLHAIQRIRARIATLPRGFAAFWDPDHAPRRSARDWEELSAAGLRRVVVGLETGDGALRAGLGKSSRIDAFLAAVASCKEARVPLGVTVLVGAGGQPAWECHLCATVAVAERLHLEPNDIIYLSPLAGSMPRRQLEQQAAALTDALRARTPAKVVPYGIERFRYYA